MKSRVIQSVNSKTQYLTIPAALVGDSKYPLHGKDVTVTIDTKNKRLIISNGGMSK